MCTLSAIPTPDGVRVAINRDESPARPAAIPPRVVGVRGTSVLMPIDPVSGGTWIAGTSRGLVFALLNSNPGTDPAPAIRAASRSRGEIIPALADAADSATATRRAMAMDTSRFPPFRLVIVDPQVTRVVTSPGYGRAAFCREFPSNEPFMLASSGLGDDLVEPPRRGLFHDLLAAGAGHWRRSQDEFHAHRWGDRLHLSVNMERAGARTVSRAVVLLRPDSIVIEYSPSHRGVFAPAGTSVLSVDGHAAVCT